MLAQLVVSLTADPGAERSILALSHTVIEIDHEKTSTVILLSLIQEGLLSDTSKCMCTKYWLTA